MPGAMCPSYHATRDEKDTTRARANTLREMLTAENGNNGFQRPELKEVMDLCLSCKACASECPSNVDMATLKAEFLYQYQETNGYTFRNKLFAHAAVLNRMGSRISWLTNALHSSPLTGGIMKNIYGIASQRSIPRVSHFDFDKHLQNLKKQQLASKPKVVLFLDEFTSNLDVEVGKDAIEFLVFSGYDVHVFKGDSARAQISKGFLRQAIKQAEKNILQLSTLLDGAIAFIGIEPSAILTFKDEYLRFGLEKAAVDRVAEKTVLFEEFVANEVNKGNIQGEMFTQDKRTVYLHSHCHQKALSNQKVSFDCLNLPRNYVVKIINSGCCGMAGSFGYEKEHYQTSMKIGELRLFPAIRKKGKDDIIAANGTSCRHQIFDGTKRLALHPATILNRARI